MGLDVQTRRLLRGRFLNNLPGRVAQLAAVLHELETDAPGAGVRARSLAHQLRGSGASFGCQEITDAGELAELSLPGALLETTKALLETVGNTIADAKETRRRKVLLVGAELGDSAPLRYGLSALGLEFVVAQTAEQAEHQMAQTAFDLVALDLVLPDADGRHLLTPHCKGASIDACFVVISTWAGADVKRECFGAGAEQFLEKPVDPGLLCTVVVNAVARKERMQSISTSDPLTGAGNRTALNRAFVRVQADRIATPTPVSIAVMDLDHFKQLNDTRGHAAGDAALQRLVATLRSQLRGGTDHVIRWGGDEFVVLFGGANPDDAARALERVQARMAEPNEQLPGIGLSCGIAAVDPKAELDEVLATADAVLYAVKRAGRGRVATEGSDLAPEPVRILLADDDELLAKGVGDLLRREGFTVAFARDGQQAWEMLQQHKFVAAILDHMMPQMTGVDVLREIRRHDTTRSIPVLILTALGNEQEVAKAFELGADDYVVKPFRAGELLARVRRLVRRGPNAAHLTPGASAMASSA